MSKLSVSNATRNSITIMKQAFREPVAIQKPTYLLNQGKLKYLFFLRSGSLYPYSLFEATLFKFLNKEQYSVIVDLYLHTLKAIIWI